MFVKKIQLLSKVLVISCLKFCCSQAHSWLNYIIKYRRATRFFFTTLLISGVVSWAEYHKYFLLKNGLSEDYAEQHNEKHRELQRPIKGKPI